MKQESKYSRWYDKDPKMQRALELIESLSDEDREELAINLIQLINLLRKNKKDDEIPFSIGKKRTLGLYMAFNKRRWYDKNSVLMSAMNILGTLPVEDCRVITEGILMTIEEQNSTSQNLEADYL